ARGVESTSVAAPAGDVLRHVRDQIGDLLVVELTLEGGHPAAAVSDLLFDRLRVARSVEGRARASGTLWAVAGLAVVGEELAAGLRATAATGGAVIASSCRFVAARALVGGLLRAAGRLFGGGWGLALFGVVVIAARSQSANRKEQRGCERQHRQRTLAG